MLRTLLQEKQKLIGEERGRAKQEKQLCPYLVKGSEGVARGPDAWVSKYLEFRSRYRCPKMRKQIPWGGFPGKLEKLLKGDLG